MSDDLSLFGEDRHGDLTDGASRSEAPAADWQVALLRQALDARGLRRMEDRRRAIEEIARREILSLRDLTSEEALQVLSHLGSQSKERVARTSAWEDREGDTWIDRL